MQCLIGLVCDMIYMSYGANGRWKRDMNKTFITKIRQDKEFQRLYDIEKKKLDIAIALAKARQKKGMTQGQVAKRAGVSWETVSRIENGRVNSSVEVLSRLFAAVGKRLDFEIS